MKLSLLIAAASIILNFTLLNQVQADSSSPVSIKVKGQIAENADLVTPLLPGEMVPDVNVWSEEGKPFSLAKVIKSKPTIVVFYRGGWCPYCNTQLRELQGIEKQLSNMGYQLLAISPELPDVIKEMKQKDRYSFHLLSDFQLEVSKAFGVAFKMKDKTIKKYQSHGIKLQQHESSTSFNLPVPAVFVFDTEGRVQFSYANPNYSVRLHPKLLITAAEVALLDENVRHKG